MRNPALDKSLCFSSINDGRKRQERDLTAIAYKSDDRVAATFVGKLWLLLSLYAAM